MQTTYRQLLEIPHLEIGGGEFNWRITDSEIEFEDPEYGGRFTFNLDEELTVFGDGVWGKNTKGERVGMMAIITREITEEDLKK